MPTGTDPLIDLHPENSNRGHEDRPLLVLTSDHRGSGLFLRFNLQNLSRARHPMLLFLLFFWIMSFFFFFSLTAYANK